MAKSSEQEKSARRLQESQSPYGIEVMDQNLILPKGVDTVSPIGSRIYGNMYYTDDELLPQKKTDDGLCDSKNITKNYQSIKNLLGNKSDFKEIWSYLKYISTKKGNTPSNECAIKYYGDFLLHDHQNRILREKEGENPQGWICSNNPFKQECRYIPLISNKEKFVRWVSLLNDDRYEFAYSKKDIVKGSKHWKLQEENDWKFVKPSLNNEIDFKNFVKSMNQYAGEMILESRIKGKSKSAIKKEIENLKNNSNTSIDNLESTNKDNRQPLLFDIDNRVEKAIFGLSPTSAVEINYLIKNYKKEDKESILKNSHVSELEKEIIRNYSVSNKQSKISKNEEENFANQVSLLSNNVTNSIETVGKELGLCGNSEPKGRSSIPDSVKKRRSNHFNFSSSICTDTNIYMRQFSVSPLFNGWVNTQSINSKIFTINSPSKFIQEYESHSQDTPDNLKMSLKDKIDYADNTPLILSLSTGKNMTPNFINSISKKDQINQSFESTMINEKASNKSDFHQCINDEIKTKTSKIKINGIDTFPVDVQTNVVKVKSKTDNKIRSFWGIKVNYGVVSSNDHVGSIFNYTHKDGLKDLQAFLASEYMVQNQALRKCLKKD